MSYKLDTITVMIVEEAQEMFELTRAVLQTFGVTNIISANSINSGFRKFCNYNPDLVILDWLEGDLGANSDSSGLKLIQHIRKDKRSPNQFVPIIMMTGYSIKRNISLARDNGATEFIAKPYTAETLYKKIEHIIEQPRKFVKTPNFFGPDRRRHDILYKGEERRAIDIVMSPMENKE